MKRRKFLTRLTKAAAVTPILINGLPMRALGAYPHLKRYARGLDDRILVLIQLHGGNDGLNTLVPIDQYSNYESLRSNIAIPSSGSRKYIDLDNTLSAADKVGLHPDLTAMKSMYDDGKVSIIQSVSVL